MTPPPDFNDRKAIEPPAVDKSDGGVKGIDLRHTAKLARLRLTDDELKLFESQVHGILEFVDHLKEVSVEGVEPTSHPLPIANVFREDTVRPSLSVEPLLKRAPHSRGRFFEVPKIIEDKT